MTSRLLLTSLFAFVAAACFSAARGQAPANLDASASYRSTPDETSSAAPSARADLGVEAIAPTSSAGRIAAPYPQTAFDPKPAPARHPALRPMPRFVAASGAIPGPEASPFFSRRQTPSSPSQPHTPSRPGPPLSTAPKMHGYTPRTAPAGVRPNAPVR